MVASRNSVAAGLAALAVTVGSGGLAAAPAHGVGAVPELRLAQGAAPPVRLGPRQQPQPSAPAAPAPAAVEPLPPSGPAPLILPKVDVQTLSEIDPDSVGVLDDAQGGLGIDMWRGADRAAIARLLPLLPHRAGSPTVRDLLRRLLLTRATAPRAAPAPNGAGGTAAPNGAGGTAAPNGASGTAAPNGASGTAAPNGAKAPTASNGRTDTPRLLGLRIEALFAIGDLDGALKLFRLVEADRAGEPLVRDEVEALFFNNDNAGACKEVRERAQSFTGVYWLQASAYCLALGGDTGKAGLVTELLGERKSEVNPAFFALMDAIGGVRTATVASLADPLALHMSMMRAANLRLPDDILRSGRPAVLRAAALSPNADFGLRLHAAEGAFAAGALAVGQLQEIYANVPFEPAELSSPLTAAEAAWGPRGRALLMRAAAQHDVPAARAEVLQKAIQLGHDKGGLPVVLAAAVPLLAPIRPAGDLMWFAADAARALFAAGRLQDAMSWYALARQDAATNPAAAAVAAALWPLAALSGTEGAAADAAAAFDRWWAAQPKGKDIAASALRAQRVLALLDANGMALGDAPWATLAAAAPDAQTAGPSAAVLHMLGRAAADRRRGEVVTLALIALGDEGPAASTQAVETATRALRAVGLDKEARALALESMVAAGL